MKTKISPIESIGRVMGVITSLELIGYFLLMKVLGYEQILELRFFNFVILAVSICYGINKLKHELHEEEFYLKGWGLGIYISAVATLIFGTFMAIYISYFDLPLLQAIQNRIHMKEATGITIFVAILMEGMASAFVITLSAMQYFKSPGHLRGKNVAK